jgi:hypothetical protein
VLGVPFWVLLGCSVVFQPLSQLLPGAGTTAVQLLAPLLLLVVAPLRAIPTQRFLSAMRPVRIGVGCGGVLALGLSAFLLIATANMLAPAVVATRPATATVAECHHGAGKGHALECTGTWPVPGGTTTQTLPVTGTPGGTVAIVVRADNPAFAYAPLSAGREVGAGALGLGGLALLGLGAAALAAHSRRVDSLLREALSRA